MTNKLTAILVALMALALAKSALAERVWTFRALGLEWQRDASGPKQLALVKDYCSNLSLAGGGRRLPSKEELLKLYAIRRSIPELGDDQNVYWSSSLDGKGYPYIVNYVEGRARSWNGYAFAVRCVR